MKDVDDFFLRFVDELMVSEVYECSAFCWSAALCYPYTGLNVNIEGICVLGSMLMSLRMHLIEVVCCADDVAVMYSASNIEKAVIDCVRKPHPIGVRFYRWIMPDIDSRSVTSTAKYAGLYLSSKLVLLWCCSL